MRLIRSAGLVMLGIAFVSIADAEVTNNQFVQEGYPQRVEATRQQFHRQLQAAAASAGANKKVAYYLMVPTLQRWQPGQTVRIAFKGGDVALHDKIAQAATTWLQVGGANLVLSFKDGNGKYRTWADTDSAYSAEIRIAFTAGQDGGYWSLVGTESTIADIWGGAPNQASMNLERFDVELPLYWNAIVLHEFGHALGFEHEHQHPRGGCDFRYDDDFGYVATKDAKGWFTTDENGKHPGVYTLLGGYPNYWPKEKVDYNLRALQTSSAYLEGLFDKDSIMKYFFKAIMFHSGHESACYTDEANRKLSQQDIKGVQRAYPRDAASIAQIRQLKRTTLEQLRDAPAVGMTIKSHASRRLEIE